MKNVFPITFIDRLIKKHELRQPFRLTGTRMYQRARWLYEKYGTSPKEAEESETEEPVSSAG